MPTWIRTRGASCASLGWSADDPGYVARWEQERAASARVVS